MFYEHTIHPFIFLVKIESECIILKSALHITVPQIILILLTSSIAYLEPVCCSMSSSNCCFLTCIQVSQEAGQVLWYSHLFQNFPQFLVIRTVKGFGIVNKAEIDVFLELSCFFHDPADVGNLIFGSSAF